MTKRLVVVAGNIATGKTSLTERIGARLGWYTAFESVVDNPYLADFYADMRAWAFHLQIFFLGHRAQQYLQMVQIPQSVIIDRSIYEDAHIFARALYQIGSLSERDYQSYRTVFDLIVNQLPPPDLLIYLQAPVEVLIERIRQRGRSIESGITVDYLKLLETLYEDWLQTFDLCPVLTIRTDDLDYVHHPKHLNLVVERIRERLSGKEEVVFPPSPIDG
ncbi:MAG: deoxynucleoside kinase [Anaerolineales bacterium]|nr:deoxynucleoside kinase [Anaerolineales bacterium]MDW8160470.1 deoxynucleoside kinase [Anaerolineales bacterium]